MSLVKTYLLICLSLFSTNVFSDVLSVKEAKVIAGDLFLSHAKRNNKPRLSYDVVKSPFKKSYLIRVNYLSLMDVPSILIAVGNDRNARKINSENDLQVFFKDLNSLIKDESLDIKNTIDASLFVKEIANIYGIYKTEINCEKIAIQKKFKCKISNASPRKYNGELILNSSGILD